MSKWIKITLILLGSSSCFSLVHAQNLQEDLIEVYKRMGTTPFRMEVEMEVIHWNGLQETTINKGRVKKSKDSYYTNFDSQERLTNPDYNVVVMASEKKIIYVPLQKTEGEESPQDLLQLMNDTNLLSEGVRLIADNKQYKEYEITADQAGMNKMTIKITKKKTLKQVTYHYTLTEESTIKQVTINYNNLVFNPAFAKNEFSEQQYFTIQNGKPVVNSAFKNYTLVYGGF